MKLFTSYYSNFKNIPDDYMCVGISRYCPEGFKNNEYQNFMFVKDNILAPDSELLKDFKSGKETEEGYKRRYVERLLSEFGKGKRFESFERFIESIIETFSGQYKAVVFLCFEKPDQFCHRHIVAKLINILTETRCEELEVSFKKENGALF